MFDAVLSCLGVMFAPDQERAAAELVRVCRPGGTIALANWTPTSFIGDMLRTVAAHVWPPAGLRSPVLWGADERLRELLADTVSELRSERWQFVFRFRSAEDFVDFFRACYGPVRNAFEALDEPGRERLHDDLRALAEMHDIEPGPSVALPSEYLVATAIRR